MRLKAFGSILFSKLFYFFLLFLTIVSCRKLVTNEFPDFPEVPVINSILVADSILKVHVSLTSKIGDSNLPLINDAKVVVTSDSENFDTLLYIGDSYYSSKTIVEPRKKYTCQVSIPGYKTITCSNTIPVKPQILNIEHINNAGRDEEGTTYPALKITFRNNPDEIQYFQIAIKLMEYDNVKYAQIINISDPVLLNEGIPLTVFSNLLIDSIYNIYKNEVKFGFTNYSTFVTPSALASECAANQNKFWQFHDSSFVKKEIMDSVAVFSLAKSIDIDMNKFKNDFADEKLYNKIELNLLNIRDAGIYGTPTILINDRIIFNSSSIEEITNALNEELKNN